MFGIFETLSGLIKKRSAKIDNNVFSLHYRLTVMLLVGFCLIIGSRKYFGDPIDCTAVNTERHIADQYCWFNSYIFVRRNPPPEYKFRDEPMHPVITSDKKYLTAEYSRQNKDSKYKASYLHVYQWIEFILFGQAMLFFLPRYLWRYCWENGRVKTITEGFTLVTLTPNEKHKDKSEDIVSFFRRNKLDHFEYAWKFIICEFLNFANVVTQFVLVQKTLALDWETLADDFFTGESNYSPHHPINLAFPNVAKCDLPTSGGSSISELSQFCVLPVNVFVTKAYIFLWFYLYVLMIIDSITLVYRLATVFIPQVRTFVLNRTGKHLPSECGLAVRNLSYGDWFVLCLVGNSMDPFSFEELVRGLGEASIASRSSFALVANEKLYNPDLAALHMRRESTKNN